VQLTRVPNPIERPSEKLRKSMVEKKSEKTSKQDLNKIDIKNYNDEFGRR